MANMANNTHSQAPEIKYNGDKMREVKGWGKAIRTHELEAAIMNGLGPKDMAMLKIMLFLTGNAEGFRIAEKTICERCNISESGYKTARKKLCEMGWITHEAGGHIIVNYNKILGNKGYSENTSQGISENTSLGYSENTHNNISNNINNNISLADAPKDKMESVKEMMKNSTNPDKSFKF
jgi:hypothetical protein